MWSHGSGERDAICARAWWARRRANNADVQHFLGFLLVRQHDCGGALDRLRRGNDGNVEITGRDLWERFRKS
jgi:hypothetical protein